MWRRPGRVRPCSSPEKPASARPAWRPSWRGAPATEGLTSYSVARSISSARSCPISRSLTPCAHSEILGSSVQERRAHSSKVFEQTLALLTERAAIAPVLLVLEDLHWADTSTLDLVVFLAHNLDDRRAMLLVTYRADEPTSSDRMHRLAEGVRRSGSSLLVELGPLEAEAMAALLTAHVRRSPVNRAGGRDRRPLRGQPVLRRGARRRRTWPEQRAPDRPARPAAPACDTARSSDAEPAAPRRGGRTRCRLPTAARHRPAIRAHRARVTPPSGRTRRPRGRSGGRHVSLSPCPPRRGDLRTSLAG